MKKKVFKFLVWIIVLSISSFYQPGSVTAQDNVAISWPKEITIPEGKVVIYQPQPEKLDGNRLLGRAAVSVKLNSMEQPVFGAIWFDTRLNIDRSTRMATIADVKVTDVRFPDQKEEKAKKLKTLLEAESSKWDYIIDMDRLLTSIDMAEKREIAAQQINTDPPKIFFVTEPAVLITIEGEPRLQQVEDTSLMRVINTPYTILFSSSDKTYYLSADQDTWYKADDIRGSWKQTQKVPAEVASKAPKPDPESGDDIPPGQKKIEPGPPPAVYVATEPTELISSTGEPEYTPISDTDLLYMSNTDSDVLMHIMDKQYYVLLSGRWYSSAKLDGPWKYLPGEKLPSDFAKIPEDSQMGTVLYAVPGTDVAREAVLDAHIPQTAAVDPKKATLTVEYDGDPKFEKIKDTKMSYAVNTVTPVIQLNNMFYACDQAVWFVADNPVGLWKVAASIPVDIYTIPPESPVYNVTFVRIYETTPEVIYVGYSPGYTNTYVYHNTIVYGTGYYWPGWYGHYYYPRPSTWGFHVRWNPWSGWGFGLSYSNGPFRFTIGGGGWYRGGWWGPTRYRGYNRGYHHGYRHGANAGYRAGYRAGRSDSGRNVYRSQRNQARVTATHDRAKNRARTSTAVAGRAYNVYADRQGNVHRRTDQGWQSRTKDGWQSQGVNTQRSQAVKSSQPVTRENRQPVQRQMSTTQRSTTQRSTQQLNRSYSARQQGASRASSYRSSSRSGGSRPSGGRGGGGRGGGGGRR